MAGMGQAMPFLAAAGALAATVATGGAAAPLLAGAAPWIGAAGAGLGAVGTLVSANNQAAADRYNASVASANATNAMSAANATAMQQHDMSLRQQGQIAAAYGGAGVNAAGSPLTVMSDQAAQGELARQLTLYKGRTQANFDTSQAAADTAQGALTKTAGQIGAAGTLLTGAGKFSAQMYPPPGGAGTPMIGTGP